MKTVARFLFAALLVESIFAQSPCPTCATTTVYIAPPCAPHIGCTGPATPPTPCTSTIDFHPTTYTIPGSNPACPTTPRTTSYLNCPPAPACYARLCETVTLGEPGTEDMTVTEPPLKCIATTTYTLPPSSSRSLSWDTTRTPPPMPTFPPDEEFDW